VRTRVEIDQKQTESRETDELAGYYAPYLSVAERG
jgi:hypothetical protein